MTETITSASNICEKAGIVLRDLLRANTALVAMIGRDANDSIFSGRVSGQKPDFEPKYPYVRVDYGDDIRDLSVDGTLQSGPVRLKVTAFSENEYTARKIMDAAYGVIASSGATLLAQGMDLLGRTVIVYDEPRTPNMPVTNAGVVLNFTFTGSRS